MDSEAQRQRFVEAMVELVGVRSEHKALASEMVRAARTQDAENFVRLNMTEWLLPGRVAALAREIIDLRIELARALLETTERGIEQAKRTIETPAPSLTAVSDRSLIEEPRRKRQEAERELTELGKGHNEARKSLAIGEAVKTEADGRIGHLDDLAENGRPPYDVADFSAWYQLGDAPPADDQKTRATDWWGAFERAREANPFGWWYQ